MTNVRPFDARLQLLTDRPADAASWGTVSLVTALREYVQRDAELIFPPSADHDALICRCGDELTRRGLDADSLVRYGLTPEFVSSVAASIVSAWFDLANPAVGAIGRPEDADKAAQWLELLRPELSAAGIEISAQVDPTPSSLALLVVTSFGSIVPWALAAPLTDLISLRPPTREELYTARTEDQVDQDLVRLYRWAVDRFSVTRLEDWATESLDLEYRWLNGTASPPCKPELMAARTIEKADVAVALADRSTAVGSPSQHALRASLTSRMQRQALELLRTKRYEEAATLFEFAVNEDADDASALNNLGFCLLPTDPRAAMRHLRRSAGLGYEPAIVNVCNRVIGLALTRGAAPALALAEESWSKDLAASMVSNLPATLWSLTGGSLELIEQASPREHLAKIAKIIASEAGDLATADLWTRRIAA